MPTREEKIAFIQQQMAQQQQAPAAPEASDQQPSEYASRADKIAFIQDKLAKGGALPTPKGADLGPTVVDKLAQGASLGFADEASGGVEALGRMLGFKGAGGKFKDMRAAEDGPTLDPNKLKAAYIEGRNRDRATLDQEQADHPIVSTAAEIGGSLVNPITKLMPGTGIAKTGAVMGAVQGVGNSEADNVADIVKDAEKGGALGAAGGKLIEAAPGMANSAVKGAKSFLAKRVGADLDVAPVANKDAIVAAADKLGIKVPQAVLTDNPTFQKLESGLSQSGSLPAREIRESYQKLQKGLEDASGKIADLKTPESDFSLGQSIKEDLTSKVQDAKKPVSELYQSFQPDMEKIEVNRDVAKRVFADLKKDPMFKTDDGRAFLDQHQRVVDDTSNLASLKEVRTNIGDSLKGDSSSLDSKRVNALQRAVTKIRNNSVEALKGDLPASAHGEVDDLINQISLADSAHASNVKDINSIKSLVGNKEINSPGEFLAKVADTKEADFAQRAANLDVKSMQSLKDQYPSVFEKAKNAKINDMIDRSTNSVSGFNESRFFKVYDGLDKESQELLFSPEMRAHIDALKTVKSAIPDKLGPSGTHESQMTMDMFSPRRNAADYAIKKTLQNASKPAVADVVEAAPIAEKSTAFKATKPILQLLTGAEASSPASPAVSFPRAAQSQDKSASATPIKGPLKWANDGLDKLIEHVDDPKVENLLNDAKPAMMADPKMREMLAQASDLKPGSKAMENILYKIKNRVAGGNN